MIGALVPGWILLGLLTLFLGPKLTFPVDFFASAAGFWLALVVLWISVVRIIGLDLVASELLKRADAWLGRRSVVGWLVPVAFLVAGALFGRLLW